MYSQRQMLYRWISWIVIPTSSFKTRKVVRKVWSSVAIVICTVSLWAYGIYMNHSFWLLSSCCVSEAVRWNKFLWKMTRSDVGTVVKLWLCGTLWSGPHSGADVHRWWRVVDNLPPVNRTQECWNISTLGCCRLNISTTFKCLDLNVCLNV